MKFILINVESFLGGDSEEFIQYQVWPHLGILYIATVAVEEGFETHLHDELVEGPVDLEKIVSPGDIVGLSLVATGIERGIELARQAKQLGARYVVAGNDSAAFRAHCIMRLPDKPIDAVFDSNSLTAVRQFLRHVRSYNDLENLQAPGIVMIPSGIERSNDRDKLKAEGLMRRRLFVQGLQDPQDVFIVPMLDLYSDEYWERVWNNYRTVFGHKHQDVDQLRNCLALFAQGCTRTGQSDVCAYCTISGVADIRIPTREYLQKVLLSYESFGINMLFNTTDSVFEMRPVLSALQNLGAHFAEGLTIYGRAWGLAHHPKLIEKWRSLTGGRLLINVGMDSGDADMLNLGIVKASQSGDRLEENRQAIKNIATSGAHLHYSMIFGSPGETPESCQRSLEFFAWTQSKLGPQLDQCETDIYWLNHGSPCSRLFYDYDYAVELARHAGKHISRDDWHQDFHRHRDTLIVPWSCEEAWYRHFTDITVEYAQACNDKVKEAMSSHEGALPGRQFSCGAYKPS